MDPQRTKAGSLSIRHNVFQSRSDDGSSSVVVVAEIAAAVAVPTMIVLDPAAVAVPIPREELSSLITRSNPDGAGIGWASPIPGMPLVMVSDRVPVTVHPKVIWSRGSWPDVYDA